MRPHPATGVLLNEVEVHHGTLTDKELQTAQLLLAEGHPRWLVGAMLGCHPLAFNGTGRRPADSRRRLGGHLTTRDARRDVRQIGLDDWEPPIEE
ncbi:hypothetical protein [Cypionkella sinensis]|uniref:Uncharacterized protein n=2 Tax=Cypionkella sinensis TaxID=1756043 RepID=A0ABV7IZD3_9RHOB